MVVIAYSVVISMVLALFWPVVQTGINNFGIWIANSSETSPVLAPFIYGTLERLLLPFGLHHMLTIPMNYTSFGGTYTIATGVNAGSQVFGQDPLWLAWANDLINFKKAGDMAAYNNLLATVTPARFKVGQMIGATGLLLGIALAMYRRVDADKRKNYKSMFISTALAVFLTGVTEPLEFMFMFCAMPLYIVYAILQGEHIRLFLSDKLHKSIPLGLICRFDEAVGVQCQQFHSFFLQNIVNIRFQHVCLGAVHRLDAVSLYQQAQGHPRPSMRRGRPPWRGPSR